MTEQELYMVRVLEIYDTADTHELFWKVTGTKVAFYAICSDWFVWGSADCEEIIYDDLELLQSCLDDLKALEKEHHTVSTAYLGELFASRKRKMRPQRPCYKDMDEHTAKLFDAAGPPRED